MYYKLGLLVGGLWVLIVVNVFYVILFEGIWVCKFCCEWWRVM